VGEVLEEGDQIERIFDEWAFVYFWAVLKNYRSSPTSWASFFQGESYGLFCRQTSWAKFGFFDFLTNASGHPVLEPPLSYFQYRKIFA
jgi:hypothetical protein